MRNAVVQCVIIFICISVHGQNNVEKLYTQGIKNYRTTNYKGAVKDFTELLKVVDNKIIQKRCFINRGLSYDRMGEFDLAISDFTESIKLDSTDMASFVDRGLSYMHANSYEKAKKDFELVVSIDSNSTMTENSLYWLASIDYFLTKYESAIMYCDQFLKRNPNDPELYFLRGNVHDRLLQFEAAIEDYSGAIELKNDYYQAYVNRGTAKINVLTTSGIVSPTKKQTKSACKDLKKAKSLGDRTIDDLLFIHCKN